MEDNQKTYAVVQFFEDDSFEEMYCYKIIIRLQTDDEQHAKNALEAFKASYPDNDYRILVTE